MKFELRTRRGSRCQRRTRTPRQRRRAIIMVIVLWVIVLLSVIAASLASEVQLNTKLALAGRQQFEAYNLARSAISVGMTHLRNDLLIQQEENAATPYDAPSDVWAQPYRRDRDREVKLGRGTYQLEIEDEEGRIPLNYMTAKLAKAMLEFYGYEPPDSDDIARAMVDYRDPDDTVTDSPAEKENTFYSALSGQRIGRNMASADLVFHATNEFYLAPDQLLDIPGIDPVVYYGYDPESEEARELKLRNQIAAGRGGNARATEGEGRRSGDSRRRRGGRDTRPMKDIVTTFGPGRVNVNTAPFEVLAIILYAAGDCRDLEGAKSAAESIVKFRGDGSTRTPNPDDALKAPPDLQKIAGLDPGALSQLQASGAVGINLAFQSQTFRIEGTGRVGATQRTITALVDRNLEVYNPDDARLQQNGIRQGSSFVRRARGGGAARSSGGGAGSGGGRRGLSGGAGSNKGQDDNFIRIPAIRVLQWIE